MHLQGPCCFESQPRSSLDSLAQLLMSLPLPNASGLRCRLCCAALAAARSVGLLSAATAVRPKCATRCATHMIWPRGVSLDLGFLHWILRVCCWQGALLYAEAHQRSPSFAACPAFSSLPSYNMTSNWSFKPARSGGLALGSARGPQNLYLYLFHLEIQREDCALSTGQGQGVIGGCLDWILSCACRVSKLASLS